MISNRSVPASTLLPHIIYPDVAEAIEWLRKTFGFTEHYRYGEPGLVGGAQMHLGDAWMMLRRARPGSGTPAELGAATQSLTVFIDDVDTHFARTQAAGARIIEDLHETEYGERQYGVVDFAGHHWLFSRHARDVNPAEWGAIVSTPATLPAQTSISPMLSVRNGTRAIEFYEAAFAAQVLFRVGGEESGIVAELSVDGARFWLADESPEHFNFSPESLGGATTRLILTVDDPDAVFAKAVAAGAKEVAPVADQPYEWRVGRVLDPFGHHWEIGKPL